MSVEEPLGTFKNNSLAKFQSLSDRKWKRCAQGLRITCGKPALN